MTGSLAIAAPPLLVVLVLLWSLDRQAGRSGTVLLLSLLWGGLVATSLVLAVNATWLEQPGWYPYVVTPVVEELAKAALFAVLVALRLVPGVPAGLAYGLACGLGFAMWENAAYFEQAEGVTVWLYLTRTAGTALLHAASTAIVGAAAGAAGQRRRALVVVALAAALGLAVGVHGAWNYVCLVLSNDSSVRRLLPGAGVTALLGFLCWSVLRERWLLRREMLALWQEKSIDEDVAKAMMARWPSRSLRLLGARSPGRLARAIWELASLRRQERTCRDGPASRARRRLDRQLAQARQTIDALLPRGQGQPLLRDRRVAVRAALAVGLVASSLVLNLLGQMSPVPTSLSSRTTVIAGDEVVRPEPLITVRGRDTYLLWQRGESASQRRQMLSWIGPAGQATHRSLGTLPADEPDWFEMSSLGEGVAVATRHGDELWLRAFVGSRQQGETRFPALEEGPVPCWPWLTSDRGRTLVGWDRLRRMAWLRPHPLGPVEPGLALPDPFPGVDTPETTCARGLVLTDRTVYEVVRPGGQARVAAVDLDTGRVRPLDVCPGEPGLRVHSLDKDRGQVLVLLGGKSRDDVYRLLLARLDRAGHVVQPCVHVRSMPSGEPRVVSLAGAGDDAFLAWSTGTHILLARVPLREGAGRARRWVLDRAPPDGEGVVRVGVVEGWLFVAWEGSGRRRDRWSLKLLRTELEDLP